MNLLQVNVWRLISARIPSLPHALLISGAEGIGKLELAEALARRLLCLSPLPAERGAWSCGECTSCRLVASGNHPDLRWLQPEEAMEEGSEGESKRSLPQIKINQIREMEDFFNVSSHVSPNRVCIIEPAEAMNAIAANALLKILEEPSPSFYFIMVSHRWRELLPTLRSRAQRILCAVPEPAVARAWLTGKGMAHLAPWLPFFGNAPRKLVEAQQHGRIERLSHVLQELAWLPDPLVLAEKLEAWQREGLDPATVIETLQKWLVDLALQRGGGTSRFLSELRPLPHAPDLAALIAAYRQLVRLRPLAHHPLNSRLFLEDLCCRALAPWRAASPA